MVAGFQGVDEDGNITTLGRGGTDTSAVAVAAAIKADACEIYTDVDGVYTTDPNVCPTARKIDRICYEEMLELASLGAKVLQIRSVEFAMKYGAAVGEVQSFTDEPGTLVGEEDASHGGRRRQRRRLRQGRGARSPSCGVPTSPASRRKLFGALADENIVVDMIVQNVDASDGKTDLTFTVGKTDLAKATRRGEEGRPRA